MPIRTAKIQDDSRREYLVRKGADALAIGEREEALSRYRSALDYDPDDDRLLAKIAQIEASLGDARAAAADLARVLALRPADADSWNLLGVLLIENGERRDAALCWRRALALARGFETPSRNLKKSRSFPQAKGRGPLLPRAEIAKLFARRAPRLSVCLIAKDEEELLPECLDSVAGVAFEIVLVDTGSTDRTREIGKERGARVFEHAWKQDFAAARNDALRHATGDWILMIDADERLDPRDVEPLKRLLEGQEFDYASVSIESRIGEDTLATRAVRLFRNYPALCFVGRIHEQLGPSLRPLNERFGLRSGTAALRLRHLGYDPTLFTKREKAERNKLLLEYELKDNPGNAYALLKQGEALFSQGRFEEAMGPIDEAWQATRQAVEDGTEATILEEPGTLLAACALAAGDYRKVLETLEGLHARIAPTANTCYLGGVSRWALGLEGARELIEESLERADANGELFTLPEIRGATPRYVLGAVALAAGDAGTAGRRFEEALARDPGHREARFGLAEVLFHLGRPEGSVSILAKMIEEDAGDIPAWRAGAVFLVSTKGRDQAAEAWLEAALAAFPQDPVLNRLRSDMRVGAA
jgi:tetratricopeptide (TPR) repeat protein